MQEVIDEYKLSPRNELILHDRLHQIDELQNNITETHQVFTKYIENGTEMCQNVLKLVKNFESIIGFDKSISPMIEILSKFCTTMKDHYKYVQEKIIDEIDKFTNTELKVAEEDGKSAKKEYSSFSKLLDSYASVPIKKRSQNPEFNDLQTKLIAQNWTTVKSNFTFSKSLGLIERKRVLEMTSHFVNFANHLATTYNQCAQIYEKSKDNFTIIMQAIPSTADELAQYKVQTSKSEQTLQKLFYMYFKSFDESTVYTPTDSLTNEGFIWLKKPKFKKWDKRYCILKYGLLSIFKDSIKPAKTHNLLCASVKKIEDTERPSCFQITFTEEKFIFQALTSYDRDKWINIIQNNIEWILSSQSPTKNAEPKQQTQNDLDGGMVRSKSSIYRISLQPKNCVCADCGAKSPSWVCINWTTVICIQCSGVHRHLTTLVSKVRSTTLDDLDDITLKLFDVIGNNNANSILEECLNGKSQQQQITFNKNSTTTSSNQSLNNTQNQNSTTTTSNQSLNNTQNQNSNDTKDQSSNNSQDQNPSGTKQGMSSVKSLINNFNQNINKNSQPSNITISQNNENKKPASNTSNSTNNTNANKDTQQNEKKTTTTTTTTTVAGIEKISPDSTKEQRLAFITQKYKNLAFVKKVSIDVENAIRSNDILLVFKSICTGQIRQIKSALHLAAFCGDPLMCRLLALNVENINVEIDGWNALSYAAYYGKLKAAQVFMMSGCKVDTSKLESHPYRISMLKQNDEMAALFYPYWNKSPITGQLEEPPLKFE